jgi:hypothetical protein
MHLDKHVIKMCTEYAQLLSTCHRVVDGHLWKGKSRTGRKINRYFLEDAEMNSELYLACHVNHPSNIWVRKTASNYAWLYRMWIELGDEYTYRYGKRHASLEQLEYLLMEPPTYIADGPFTEPTPAMAQYPHCIKEHDSISSYRQFYWEDKKRFAKWTKRDKPFWWISYEELEK